MLLSALLESLDINLQPSRDDREKIQSIWRNLESILAYSDIQYYLLWLRSLEIMYQVWQEHRLLTE